MKKFCYILLFFCAMLTLPSCRQPVENIIVEIPVLRASAIYNPDSVESYLEKYNTLHKSMADTYFQKGVKTEKDNPLQAVFFLKRAITIYPSVAYYEELGNFSYATGDYDEMKNAYHFLRNNLSLPSDTSQNGKCFDSRLNAGIIYENLMATILDDGGTFVNDFDGDIATDARDMGISMGELRKKVFSDKRLKMDSNTQAYRDLYINFLSWKELSSYLDQPSTFHYFLSTIPDTSPVFTIDAKRVQQFNYDNFNGRNGRNSDAGPDNMLISDYFNHYLPEFKKDTTWNNPYNYNHLIKLNDSILILICAVDGGSESACPIDMRHIYHRLLTMTKNGRIIATDIVANQWAEQLFTLDFNHTHYTVTYYKRYWEKPYQAADFDNALVKIEPEGKESFSIHSDGTIVKDSVKWATP